MTTTAARRFRLIDLARDFDFQVDVTRHASTTGEHEAASGLSGLNAHIAATATGTAIGTLSLALAERAQTPGRYWCSFDRAALQTHLSAFLKRHVWVVVTKAGDVDPKPWRFYVTSLVEDDDEFC